MMLVKKMIDRPEKFMMGHGAPRASPWSPTNIPTYAPGRCSASARKRQGFGGSSAGWRNPPKHSRYVGVIIISKITHSSAAKAVPARRSTCSP